MFSLWFNGLWSNLGQANDGIIPCILRCSTMWCMIFGSMHELKWKKKINCKSFQKSDWSYGVERKTSSTNHTQFIWLKLWIKKENGVHKVTIILTPRHSCRVPIHFCMRSSGVWNEDGDCRTNLWGYGVWYVVIEYWWMIRTASCRIHHTLVRHYADRTTLN